MDTAKKLTTTVMSPDGQTKTQETSVISEHTLNVIINEQPVYRIVCTKDHLRELVTGRMVTDGIIKKKDEIYNAVPETGYFFQKSRGIYCNDCRNMI